MVYEGPGAGLVLGPDDRLAQSLHLDRGEPMVDAAMAHLNLVMTHPFREGNGRMARALQTLIMARDQVLEPTFSSIEEWLDRNTDDYHRVLALTGRGRWFRSADCGPVHLLHNPPQTEALHLDADGPRPVGMSEWPTS